MKKLFGLLISLLLISNVMKSQPVITDAFFDHTDFIGAFGSVDWTAGWCEWDPQSKVYPAPTVTIPAGDITVNTTWTSGNTYLLNGWVYVTNGATLTIEPGTVIRGDYVNKGSLIIERGAKLVAQGTAMAPIVFTSAEDAGNRDYGDWGGVILCGRASINQVGDTAEIEGGVGSVYGGGLTPVENDNSGSLEYVRIEFAGVPYVTDKEINGLTMGGVGSGTTISHIQVSYCGDDAYEWFGGKVNAKYLVSFRNWDDDFDTDNGYQGMVQYAVALRDPSIADPGSKSNGFESDNDKDGTTNFPQTAAIFSNVSMFGPKVTAGTTVNSNYKTAMHLRRNSSLSIYNSFFAGYTDGLLLDGSLCEANATAGKLNIRYSYLAGVTGNDFLLATGSVFDLPSWFLSTMDCNDTLADHTPLLVQDGFNLSSPDFLPQTGSPLLNRPWLDCAAGVAVAEEATVQADIYPNPANSSAWISIEKLYHGWMRIEVLDVAGRIINEVYEGVAGAGNQQYAINTGALPDGLYLIRIADENSMIMKKLMIAR